MEYAKLSYEIDKLKNYVEERNRLIDVLRIEPSNKDTIIFKKQLNSILQLIDEVPDLQQAEKYNDILASISGEDTHFTQEQKNLYHYNTEKLKQESELATKKALQEPKDFVKKVRFSDHNDVKENYDNSQQLTKLPFSDQGSQISGIINFAPYKDSQPVNDDQSAYSMMSNDELLAMQHDTIHDQDTLLESLSSTVHRTHDMSLGIHDEVEYQNDGLLVDLEGMVDATANTLNKAHTKLNRFNKMNRDSGGSYCRGALIFVLMILLVVLFVL
ncbi:hypothetical protein ACO0RG_003613 [Hanseniaspora osmophila]|uniref:Syntaxin-8 n=1 Tax=Hanseniaspora osmophila TaxID=56408 RepID=A0A1E5RFD8_9ASCO|nr:Syntaxin-8 [Hanseniaspora osmophila]